MNLEKYLNANEELNIFKRFANTGSRDSLDKKLRYLTEIAEKENWYQKDKNTEKITSVIFYYVIHTFEQVFKQGKISIDESECKAIANTGLMTPQGDEIYYYFEKSDYYDDTNELSNYWHFKKFLIENDKETIRLELDKPQIATYFEDYNELYFDPSKEIAINFDHIFGDRNERLPEEFNALPIDVARQVFNGFLDFTIKKIKRNNRIPVPQYYKGKIMFLIPVIIFNTNTVIIAVECLGNKYIANTTLTKGMAYNCARLLNKPESNWLLID